MSAPGTGSTVEPGGNAGSDGGSGSTEQQFQAIQSQTDLDRIISDRLSRERAKYGDYEDLKAKAVKYDEEQDRAKSEVTKARERAEAAERELSKEREKGLRATIAAAKGVPVGSITGKTKDEMEASANELIAWRDQNKRTSRVPSGSLKSGSGTDDDNKTGKERAAAALRDYRRGGA
jgi:broad specificity phosphatase PhoE